MTNISFYRSTILRNLIIYTYICLHSYFSDVTCTMTWKKNHLYRYSAIIERKLQTHSSTKTCITTYITTASTSSIMGEGGWGWGVGTLAERIMFHSCPCKRKKKWSTSEFSSRSFLQRLGWVVQRWRGWGEARTSIKN